MSLRKTFEAGLAAIGIALSGGNAEAKDVQKPQVTHVEHVPGDNGTVLVDEDGLIAENKGPDSVASNNGIGEKGVTKTKDWSGVVGAEQNDIDFKKAHKWDENRKEHLAAIEAQSKQRDLEKEKKIREELSKDTGTGKKGISSPASYKQ